MRWPPQRRTPVRGRRGRHQGADRRSAQRRAGSGAGAHDRVCTARHPGWSTRMQRTPSSVDASVARARTGDGSTRGGGRTAVRLDFLHTSRLTEVRVTTRSVVRPNVPPRAAVRRRGRTGRPSPWRNRRSRYRCGSIISARSSGRPPCADQARASLVSCCSGPSRGVVATVAGEAQLEGGQPRRGRTGTPERRTRWPGSCVDVEVGRTVRSEVARAVAGRGALEWLGRRSREMIYRCSMPRRRGGP